jgi:hypothetical protein
VFAEDESAQEVVSSTMMEDEEDLEDEEEEEDEEEDNIKVGRWSFVTDSVLVLFFISLLFFIKLY